MTAITQAHRRMRTWCQAFTDALYPPACLLCHARVEGGEALWCEACRHGMPSQHPPVCGRCGAGLRGAFDARLICASCRRHPPAFEMARAPFVYESRVREAIHAFKYRGRHRIGRWLAEAMAVTARHTLPLAGLRAVVAVPMHPLKQRLKGANPAVDLAATVAHGLGLPYTPDLLRRRRWTPTQTRLNAAQRFRNVRDAFRAHLPRVMDGTDGAVLLIDDVLTSGATAHACALALREAGISRVVVLTAARA